MEHVTFSLPLGWLGPGWSWIVRWWLGDLFGGLSGLLDLFGWY
jgi:hypothetical protein